MRRIWFLIQHFAVVALLVLLLMVLETTVWFHWFNQLPAPNFWIPIIVYYCLQHSYFRSLVMIYLVSIIVSSLSSMPVALIIISQLFVFGALTLVRQRIYWGGTSYFLLATTGALLLWDLNHLMLSWLIEPNSIERPQWISWLAELLYAPLFTPALFRLLAKIDRWVEDDGNQDHEPILVVR